MPAHTVSNRKKTIMGSRRLHRVYRKIMNNKALTVALMAIVAPLVGLLMTSKGMPTSHYEELRKALAKLPFGRFLAKLIQQLVDVVRRLLGFGICEGDVVKIRDMNEVAIRENSITLKDGGRVPDTDMTYKALIAILQGNLDSYSFDNINEESEFMVYRIRKRQLQLIFVDEEVKKYSVDELKEMSVTKLAKNKIDLITRVCCLDNTTNPQIPMEFPQEHFEKSDFKLDVRPV